MQCNSLNIGRINYSFAVDALDGVLMNLHNDIHIDLRLTA